MKALIACERSGLVRDALIAVGVDAISCDLHPSRRPGPHYQCDVREVLGERWDLLIAHPVCRYMANSGVRWLHERPERWPLMLEGCEFFKIFDNARHIPMRAIENPVMHGHALKIIGRKATQYVHPYFFGAPFRKLTGWWLHGLPNLKRTSDMKHADATQKVWLMPPGPDREEKRSETEPEVAFELARQWGGIALDVAA